jgi:hypothetical protein
MEDWMADKKGREEEHPSDGFLNFLFKFKMLLL